MGIVIDPVPVTGLAANFSAMPRIAPPPLGNEIVGIEGPLKLLAGGFADSSLSVVVFFLLQALGNRAKTRR